MVSASRLIPAGEKAPLPIEDYAFSADGRQLLVFTQFEDRLASEHAWRLLGSGLGKSGALRKLGGDAPASSLMFAKFSPDSSKVGYVRGNNVYVEDLAGGKITQLTQDGSATIINGTSDWVNEEEFDIRDGFAWSPDSHAIAFWQFNSGGVQLHADLRPRRAARRDCHWNSVSEHGTVSADASVSVSACRNAKFGGSCGRRESIGWTNRLDADSRGSA